MNKKIISYILILFNLHLITSILIETGKRDKYCFYKHLETGDTIHLSYVISGENEEKVNAVLTDESNRILYEMHGSDSGEFKQQLLHAGNHKLCFLPLNANSYYISFEFFSLYEKGHTLDMAKDENLHEMKKDVTDITLMFEEMEKNVKFIMDRRNKHSEILGEIGNSIKHISYLKIVIVILVSLLQVFLIHKFFGGNKKTGMSYSTGGHGGMFEMGASL